MAIETDSLRLILAIFRINILHYMIRNRKAKVYWGQVLLFAFTHTNAIYTNALDCGRPCSFYRWAGARAKLMLKTGDIFVAFILRVRFSCVCMRFLRQAKISKKQDLIPLLTTLYGENKISGDVIKALVLERRIVNVSSK